MPNELIQALRSLDLARVRAAAARDPAAAAHAQPICEASRLGFQPAIRLLAKHGADLNASWRGYRPLHSLIQEEPRQPGRPSAARLRCLEWMLAHGADPELPAAWPPARAVIVAAFAGRPEYVERLRRKDDPFAAAALADTKRVQAAVAKRPGFPLERDTGGLTALQCAAGSRMPGDHLKTARLLLDAGAGLNAKTKSWIHDVDAVSLAASAKNASLFELFLDRGADPTEALTPALWNGTEEMAAAALARGADPDRAVAEGQPLLNHLVRWGAFRQALWLLEHGASPNVPDARGWTAVHQAASRGNEKMLRALLEAGGDPSLRDKSGRLPRDHARRGGISDLLKGSRLTLSSDG